MHENCFAKYEPSFVIYACVCCGKTLRWPEISTAMPNLICWHDAKYPVPAYMKLIYFSSQENAKEMLG